MAGWAGGSKNVKVISDQFSSLFGTSFIFLLKCSFSQIGRGGGGSKIGKLISDQISRQFSQIGLNFDFFAYGIGGSKNPEIISDQISRQFSQFGLNFDFFFMLTKKISGVGGVKKIRKLFLTNFLAILANFEQL